MTTVHRHISSLEHLLGVLVRADAHVLLAQSSHLGVDIMVRLRRKSVGKSRENWRDFEMILLTNCSVKGTFFKGILWIPAIAEPSIVPAARRIDVFMINKLFTSFTIV